MLTQVLTVSATRENEVQTLVVTFTGNTTDGGTKMMADVTSNAFVALTFDSGSMNWACTDAVVTTSDVSCVRHALQSVVGVCGLRGNGLKSIYRGRCVRTLRLGRRVSRFTVIFSTKGAWLGCA